MPQDWQALTRMTAGAAIQIERIRLAASGVAIEGQFDLPPLAQLSADDQVFVAAFVRCHGSIKQMEKFFGVSYPTIKNRLNRIGSQLPFAEIEPEQAAAPAGALLARLERGEMTVGEVLERLRGPSTPLGAGGGPHEPGAPGDPGDDDKAASHEERGTRKT